MHPVTHAIVEPGPLAWPQYLSAVLLVMVRLSGLMVFAPFFSSLAIPARVKAMFVAVVALLLAPIAAGLPLAHIELGASAILGELSAGLVFGVVLGLLNELFLFAGQLIGVQFSFSLVNLLDPNSQIQSPLLGQLFSMLSLMVLLAAGLHRTLLAALMRSFAMAPVGSVLLTGQVGAGIVQMAGGVFVAALQLSAPIMAATMLVEAGIAMMGRLSPQLPVLSLTVPAKTMLGYVVLMGSLALWPRFIEARFSGLLDAVAPLLSHCVHTGMGG